VCRVWAASPGEETVGKVRRKPRKSHRRDAEKTPVNLMTG
jgi:hypothetical protein